MECIVHQKRFHDLRLSDLYDILALRNRVFVVEQKSLFNDVDGLDPPALHFMIFDDDNKIISYGRVFMEEENPILRIGRIVTCAAHRRRGYSRKIMESILGYIHRSFVKGYEVHLQAQEHLQGFYHEYGFKPLSGVYDEDGIPHVDMGMTADELQSYYESMSEKKPETKDFL